MTFWIVHSFINVTKEVHIHAWVSHCLGGPSGDKLKFFLLPSTGQVKQLLSKTLFMDCSERKKKYQNEIQ